VGETQGLAQGSGPRKKEWEEEGRLAPGGPLPVGCFSVYLN
jgi:hypothetical protein